MIVIGYQGMENSNNNTAAALLAQKLEGPAELRPLVSSRNVVAALLAGEIDYGVMAISTDVAGEVAETREARKGTALRQLDAVSLDIHHSLFKKSPQIATESIRTIASHPEALRECVGNVAKCCPMPPPCRWAIPRWQQKCCMTASCLTTRRSCAAPPRASSTACA